MEKQIKCKKGGDIRYFTKIWRKKGDSLPKQGQVFEYVPTSLTHMVNISFEIFLVKEMP